MRNHTILPAAHLRQARLQLVERGITPQSDVDASVARSWQRSLLAGLSPIGRIDCCDNLSGTHLQRARSFNHDLISHSEPVMEYLFEQVRQSHSMVILADAQGVLMHTLGDLDFLNKADRVALKCGASWAENQRGTNAIGTALAEGQLVEVHGAEHYLDRNGFLTCAAAPIMSAQGKLVGILDISGDHRSRHPHTLGLVSTAAQMIENTMVLSACKHQCLVQLHPRAEGIGSVAQGLMAYSADGWLVGANRKGLQLLRLQYADIGAVRWTDLFETRFELFAQQPNEIFPQPKVLITHQGVSMYGQTQTQGRAHSAVSVSSQPVQDALSTIDTGDEKWQLLAQRARKVIDKSIPLLVTGESGVGKEWFAKAVHRSSLRSEKPFVAVNCAALPEHLLESELFGYVAGAFTGATRQGSSGRLREAHGGTLFLDEIGDMPLSAQTRLLRVLQERQVVPLGSGMATPVDFNLMCATHQPLKVAVEQGRFREDLYYRINGLGLRLPALRERSDFDALCRRMLQEIAPNLPLCIAPDLLEAMHAYSWPGNLRQLNHVLRTAAALLDEPQHVIRWSHLSDDMLAELQTTTAPRAEYSPPQNLHDLSFKAIQQALENARGNVSAAARQLGISRQTLYRRLQAS